MKFTLSAVMLRRLSCGKRLATLCPRRTRRRPRLRSGLYPQRIAPAESTPHTWHREHAATRCRTHKILKTVGPLDELLLQIFHADLQSERQPESIRKHRSRSPSGSRNSDL